MPVAIRQSKLTTQEQLPFCMRLDDELWLNECKRIRPTETQIQKIIERCTDDPEYYILGGFCRTFDENAIPKERVKPFPRKKYLQLALQHMHDDYEHEGTKAIVKSRQMMITWLACAYATWEARFHEFSRVMMQSKKELDACKLVYKQEWLHSRCGFIERAMPVEMRAVGLIGTKGALQYPHGSEIWGIPQGPDMSRSYTSTLYICDEAAFQPKFDEAYQAALPMARRIIIISTAMGGTAFARAVEQDDGEQEERAA